MGGIRGKGIATLLRANRLDDLSVMVREVIQNSWDARLSDDVTVEVDFNTWEFSKSQMTSLRKIAASSVPPFRSLQAFQKVMDQPKCRVLAVRDLHCQGLDGPTLGDEAIEGEKNRYISFLLNVGDSTHSEGDGGTFGYGRSITYRISECMLIYVYTRTLNQDGKPESRFVGSMLSDSFSEGGHHYTGRHWWGVVQSDSNSCRPITGPEADQLAASLGARPYAADERGTTVLIIEPIYDDPSAMMNFISDAILWNMWPKMIESESGGVPMKFTLGLDGKAVKLKDPWKTFPISQFCSAMYDIRDARAGRRQVGHVDQVGSVVHQIEALSPRIDIGLLGLRKFPRSSMTKEWSAISDEGGETYSACPIDGYPHHVAVMRMPELVVDYFKYRESPDDRLCWIGVFRANDSTDAFFKAAEPPTHDSWNRLNVPRGRASTAVSVGLERIKSLSNTFSEDLAPRPQPAIAGARSLARALSVAFQTLVDDVAVPFGSGGSGGGAAGGKKVELVVGSPRVFVSADGTTSIMVKVSMASQRAVANKIQLSLRARFMEGDDPCKELDPEVVRIVKVENARSRLLWVASKPTTEIEQELIAPDLPLSVTLECHKPCVVAVEAKGTRV